MQPWPLHEKSHICRPSEAHLVTVCMYVNGVITPAVFGPAMHWLLSLFWRRRHTPLSYVPSFHPGPVQHVAEMVSVAFALLIFVMSNAPATWLVEVTSSSPSHKQAMTRRRSWLPPSRMAMPVLGMSDSLGGDGDGGGGGDRLVELHM